MNSGLFLLLLVLGSNVLITGSFWPLLGILSAIIHELGHLAVMRLLGFERNSIRFVGLGFHILPGRVASYRQNTFIYLAGPGINFLCAGVLLLVYMFYNSQALLLVAISNLLYGAFNLLPAPPLDGYNVLQELLFDRLDFESARRRRKEILICSLLLMVLFWAVLWIYGVRNISLLLILLYLMISIFCAIRT